MKVRAFRKQKREEISENYSGWLHLSLIVFTSLLLGAAALFFLSSLMWYHFLMIPLTILIANIVEYSIHRWPMHHRLKIAKNIYKIHSGEHHRYFNHEYMNIECGKDMKEIFTNPVVVVLFVSLFIVPMALLFGLFSMNAGLLFFSIAMFYYGIYEFTHFATHMPKDHFVANLPYVRGARERHQLHHNTKLMREWNFNVSFPLMDILFRTRRQR